MRRSVTAAMSGLSVVAISVGMRLGSPHGQPASSVAQTGAASRPRTTAIVAGGSTTHHPRASAASPTSSPTGSTLPARTAVVGTRPRPVTTVTPSAQPSKTSAPKPSSKTYNGAPADTQYGPVQVQITVANGRITHATAIVYPQESGRDQQINDYAIPQLDQETLQAQSAQIDSVSGATYTSDGYIQSLQSALDAAHMQ